VGNVRTVRSSAAAFALAALAMLPRPAAAASSEREPPAPSVTANVDAVPTPKADAPTPDAASDAQLEELDAAEVSSYWDPLERGNRVVFSFNEMVDKYALGPISDAYGFIVPDPAERAVRRMFRNLSEPISFANHMLQFHPDPAGRSFVRFVVNSSIGVAGMFDVANKIGIAPAPTDFGATLHRYGTPAGPYLVLPLMGPTTARDTFGDVVDDSVMPQRYLLSTVLQIVLSTGNGITARHEANDSLAALRDGAVDFYAALRSAYFFNRESELREGAPGASDIFFSSSETKASNPDRSNTEVYSALRSASSETVPSK
jgi:phospholipid-binding lipoprotein MlaA